MSWREELTDISEHIEILRRNQRCLALCYHRLQSDDRNLDVLKRILNLLGMDHDGIMAMKGSELYDEDYNA